MFFWELSAFSCIKNMLILVQDCLHFVLVHELISPLQPVSSLSAAILQLLLWHVCVVFHDYFHIHINHFIFTFLQLWKYRSIFPQQDVYICVCVQFLWVRSVIRHMLHCTIPYVSHVVQSQCEYISRLVCAVHFYDVRSGEIIVQEVWCLV